MKAHFTRKQTNPSTLKWQKSPQTEQKAPEWWPHRGRTKSSVQAGSNKPFRVMKGRYYVTKPRRLCCCHHHGENRLKDFKWDCRSFLLQKGRATGRWYAFISIQNRMLILIRAIYECWTIWFASFKKWGEHCQKENTVYRNDPNKSLFG